MISLLTLKSCTQFSRHYCVSPSLKAINPEIVVEAIYKTFPLLQGDYSKAANLLHVWVYELIIAWLLSTGLQMHSHAPHVLQHYDMCNYTPGWNQHTKWNIILPIVLLHSPHYYSKYVT